MGPAKEPEAVGGVLKDLNLNEEEVGKFEKAFKDPTFLQMFSEYAKEITDPKSRAENDLYIRQLEKEGRAEATFGKGVELVTPEAQSVVKTKRAGTSETVYINICTSPKVEVAIGRRAEKAAENAPRGMHWDIPLMMSTQRAGTDKRGKPCSVYDLVIHPDTLRMADANARFKDIVVESAMEKVERTASCKLVRAWRPCRIRYKATPGHDQPHVLSYRTDGKPVRPAGTGQEQNSTPANATQQVQQGGSAAGKNCAAAKAGSGFKFGGQRAAAGERKVMAPRREADIGFVHATGEVTPHYEVVQRGQADLAAAWGDVGHNLHLDLSLPKELVVRVHLPGMTSMAGVALDITAHHLQLHIPTRFKLGVPLPFKVDETRGRAKYDKAHQKLEVVLPVVPPPRPDRAHQDQRSPPNALIQELPDQPETLQLRPPTTTADQALADDLAARQPSQPASSAALLEGNPAMHMAQAAAPMEVASTGDAEPPLGSGQPGLPDIADDFDDAPATVGSATSAGSLSASAAGQCSADATSRLSGSQAADQCLITEVTDTAAAAAAAEPASESGEGHSHVDGPGRAGAAVQAGSRGSAADKPLTENQRRWLELHSKSNAAASQEPVQQYDSDDDIQPASSSSAIPRAEDAQAPASDRQPGAVLAFEAAGQFCGTRPGYVFKTGSQGLGYYPDSQPLVKAPFHSAAAGQADSAPTARAVEPADADLSGMNAVAATTRPAVVRLKPRLSSRALAEELD